MIILFDKMDAVERNRLFRTRTNENTCFGAIKYNIRSVPGVRLLRACKRSVFAPPPRGTGSKLPN